MKLKLSGPNRPEGMSLARTLTKLQIEHEVSMRPHFVYAVTGYIGDSIDMVTVQVPGYNTEDASLNAMFLYGMIEVLDARLIISNAA